MQPDQEHHPDYNFIMNPGAAPKKRLFSLGGGDKKQKLLMIIIAGGLLMMVLVVVISSFLGGSGNNTDRLVGLAQRQTELARVASLGQKDAVGSDAKNLASTVVLTMTSAKAETSALITKQGRKLNAKTLAAKQDSNTDKTLEAAKQSNRFDETFVSTLQSGLTTYQQELSDLFDATESKTEKSLLQELYNQAAILTATQ